VSVGKLSKVADRHRSPVVCQLHVSSVQIAAIGIVVKLPRCGKDDLIY
jgi:hypothetical protein